MGRTDSDDSSSVSSIDTYSSPKYENEAPIPYFVDPKREKDRLRHEKAGEEKKRRKSRESKKSG